MGAGGTGSLTGRDIEDLDLFSIGSDQCGRHTFLRGEIIPVELA
jgi:hypothetical protein